MNDLDIVFMSPDELRACAVNQPLGTRVAFLNRVKDLHPDWHLELRLVPSNRLRLCYTFKLDDVKHFLYE
jgi:hypothetical protein